MLTLQTREAGTSLLCLVVLFLLCLFPVRLSPEKRSEGQVIPRMGFQLQGEWSCSGQAVHRAARALLGDGVAEHKGDPVSLPGQVLFPSF